MRIYKTAPVDNVKDGSSGKIHSVSGPLGDFMSRTMTVANLTATLFFPNCQPETQASLQM